MSIFKKPWQLLVGLLIGGAVVAFGNAPQPTPADPQVKSEKYTSPTRNYDNIQYEAVRRPLDPLYNTVHDELSVAYYNGKPFRDKGVLTKEQFERYQAALWAEYDIRFAEAMTLSGKLIPEDYQDGVTNKAALILDGYELTF